MRKRIALTAALAAAAASADVYYNAKTFSANETTGDKVYIGHTGASDGGSASDALVTVQNGATWTAGADVYLGNSSGTSRLVVDNGGTLYVNDSKYLRVGIAGDGYAVVTNNGTINTYFLYFGERYGGSSTPRMDNFGNLTVRRGISFGERSETTYETVFHNHENASLSVLRGSEYDFYLGGRSPARLINEGTVTCQNGTSVRIGGALTPNGTGTLAMSNTASFVSGKEVRIGENRGKGSIILADSSSFDGATHGASVYLGYSASTEADVSLCDNSSFSCATLVMGRGDSSTAALTIADNSTLTFEGDLNVAKAANSVATFAIKNHSMTSYSKDVYLGVGASSVGTFRLDGTTALAMNGSFYLGNAAGARGIVELDGTSELAVPDGFVVGSAASEATGEVVVKGSAKLVAGGKLNVGTVADRPGVLKVCASGVVSATKLYVAAAKGVSSQSGELVVEGSGVVTNLSELLFGRGATAVGRCSMRGGKVFLAATSESEATPLTIGINSTSTAGSVSGWGFVGFDDPVAIMKNYSDLGHSTWGGLYLYGQVVADGDGVLRDLDFSRAGVCANSNYGKNDCGTNGWYAVNKGRLIMPRSLPRLAKNHATIGDYPTLSNPRLVNSFRYDFDKDAMEATGTYVYSELYAADRTDIPSGLPSGDKVHVAAVWRIGYFDENSGPAAAAPTAEPYSSVKLKFHYDPELPELGGVERIHVYRHDGTANGRWQIVGSDDGSSAPYVETRTLSGVDAGWNVGWFAIVGEMRPGALIILR